MAQETLTKQRSPDSFGYNQLVPLDFTPVTLAAGQADSTVQARYPLALNFKLVAVSAVLSGTIAGSVLGLNIVLDAAGETGTVPINNNYQTTGVYPFATAGQQAFTTDGGQSLTMTADLVQNFFTPNPDALYPAGHELTLRIVTAAATTGTLVVVMYGVFYDTKPKSPINAQLNTATDL